MQTDDLLCSATGPLPVTTGGGLHMLPQCMIETLLACSPRERSVAVALTKGPCTSRWWSWWASTPG